MDHKIQNTLFVRFVSGFGLVLSKIKSPFLNRILAKATDLFTAFVLYFFFRLEVEGRENLPEGEGFIAAGALHRTDLDGAAIGVATKRGIGNVYFLGTAFRFAATPGLAYLCRHIWHIVTVKPGVVKDRFHETDVILEEGNVLVMFPEGTRRGGNELLTLQTGVADLTLRHMIPVVPVRIFGAREAFPWNKKFPRPFRRIRIVFGRPIYPEGENTPENRAALTEWLRESLESIK